MSYGDWDLDLGDIRVTTDQYQFIVWHKVTATKGKNAGESYWKAATYHNTPANLAVELMRLQARGAKVSNVQDIIDMVSFIEEATLGLIAAIKEHK